MNNIDQSNIWDLATVKQKIALKKLGAKQYESIMLQIIDECTRDLDSIPEKLKETLGI